MHTQIHTCMLAEGQTSRFIIGTHGLAPLVWIVIDIHIHTDQHTMKIQARVPMGTYAEPTHRLKWAQVGIPSATQKYTRLPGLWGHKHGGSQLACQFIQIGTALCSYI